MYDLREIFDFIKLTSKHFKARFRPNLVRITTGDFDHIRMRKQGMTSVVSIGYIWLETKCKL